MNLNDTFHCISTIIHTTAPSVGSQGTGFYYKRLASREKEGLQWRKVEGQWLVTNRHVLIPRMGNKEMQPLPLRSISASSLRLASWSGNR